MIACCGINCLECPALHATRDDNDQKRAEVAAQWSKEFSADITPEMINCTGCTGEGVKFIHCTTGCKIRPCCLDRNHSTCAECKNYACDILEEFFGMVPGIRDNLEWLRKQ